MNKFVELLNHGDILVTALIKANSCTEDRHFNGLTENWYWYQVYSLLALKILDYHGHHFADQNLELDSHFVDCNRHPLYRIQFIFVR